MIKQQIPNRNQLTVDKAQQLLALVNRKMFEGTGTPDEFVSEFYAAFTKLFSELKVPMTEAAKINLEDIRDPEAYQQFLLTLSADLDTLISSTRNITDATVEGFNLAVTKHNSLETMILKAQSASADLQLLDKDLSQNVMVAGDDFGDDARLTPGHTADLIPGGLGIGLGRAGVIVAMTPENSIVEVDKPDGSYEGRFFAPLGKAEPEGGAFKWVDIGQSTTFIQNMFVPAPGPEAGNTVMGVAPSTKDELQEQRAKMLDNTPDTYWQLEFAFKDPTVAAWAKAQQDAARENGQTNIVVLSDLATELDKLDITNPFDLAATITVTADDPKQVNFISLLPFNFYEGTFLEVLRVATSPDDSSPFIDVPHLHDNQNERVLTPEANEDLSDEEVAGVLTNTKAFSGHGLWVFPERTVKRVLIELVQPDPVPCPYSILHATYEQDKKITTTTKKASKNWAGKVKRTKKTEVEEQHLTKELDLDYPRSVMLHSGTSPIDQLVTSTGAADDTKTQLKGKNRKNKVRNTGIRSRKDYGNVTIEASDWTYTDRIELPRYDVVRYVLGIRDLNISKYTFTEAGAFQSVPFDFPNDVLKVSLEVIERIPDEFKDVDATRSWIKYFVSFDGNVWHQISAASPVEAIDDAGARVPKIVNLNSDLPDVERNQAEGYVDLTDGSLFTVRFKAMLTRPAGEQFQAITPVLESYRLRVFIRSNEL